MPGKRGAARENNGGAAAPKLNGGAGWNPGIPMNEHPSYLVYQHLGPFLESRRLRPAAGAALGSPRERFLNELELIGYARVDAVDARDRVTVLVILALRGKYTEKGPQLRTLISSLNSEPFAREGRLEEVVVVAPEEVMAKKNMTDVVLDFGEAVRAGSPDALAGHYSMHSYTVLSVDIPRVRSVPAHELAPPAEVQAYLARERVALADLRRVAASNPPVIWIGARPGQVVRVRSASETAGEAYDYCLVSRA